MKSFFEMMIKLIMCHVFGDYFLQDKFIATTKGENWYHLFVHAVLYCIPLYILFGLDIKLIVIFVSHFFIDMLKARYKIIPYFLDQILHYLFLIIYLF